MKPPWAGICRESGMGSSAKFLLYICLVFLCRISVSLSEKHWRHDTVYKILDCWEGEFHQITPVCIKIASTNYGAGKFSWNHHILELEKNSEEKKSLWLAAHILAKPIHHLGWLHAKGQNHTWLFSMTHYFFWMPNHTQLHFHLSVYVFQECIHFLFSQGPSLDLELKHVTIYRGTKNIIDLTTETTKFQKSKLIILEIIQLYFVPFMLISWFATVFFRTSKMWSCCRAQLCEWQAVD